MFLFQLFISTFKVTMCYKPFPYIIMDMMYIIFGCIFIEPPLSKSYGQNSRLVSSYLINFIHG
jgi:hypothetical protein